MTRGQELREHPEAFTHPGVERAGLNAAVVRLHAIEESQRARDTTLSLSLPDDQAAFEDDYEVLNMADADDEMQIKCNTITYEAYIARFVPWGHWRRQKSIATLSGPAKHGPPFQRQDPTNRVLLYKIKETKENTLTIEVRNPEVEAALHDLAERYNLQRDKGKVFILVDVFCFLQLFDSHLPIPLHEVNALKECVQTVAKYAVTRLDGPSFTLLRDRNPVLTYERNVFTLCLRMETGEQSAMWVRDWVSRCHYCWVSARMCQVMTTKTQKTVDVSIESACEAKSEVPYQVHHDISELNLQGAFFQKQGLRYAGEIVHLPEVGRPAPFASVHRS